MTPSEVISDLPERSQVLRALFLYNFFLLLIFYTFNLLNLMSLRQSRSSRTTQLSQLEGGTWSSQLSQLEVDTWTSSQLSQLAFSCSDQVVSGQFFDQLYDPPSDLDGALVFVVAQFSQLFVLQDKSVSKFRSKLSQLNTALLCL